MAAIADWLKGRSITDQYAKKDGTDKPYEPTPEQGRLIGYINAQHRAAVAFKAPIIRQAWLNLAMLTGRQWSLWDDNRKTLKDPPAPHWRVRLVLNYIRAVISTLVARTTENRPTVMILPTTLDEDDQNRARAGEKLIEYIEQHNRQQITTQEFAQLMYAVGLGIFKVYWDPFGGPDGDGFPAVDALTLFEFGWDPGAKDMRRCRWADHESAMHLDEAKSRYPDMAPWITADRSMSEDNYAGRILSALRGTKSDTSHDRVKIVEYHELPSPRFPNGIYAVVANDKVLLFWGDLPGKRLPFVVARHNMVPGRFVGDGAIKDLVAPQRELNKKASQRIENANLMANPKWAVAQGSVEGGITDEPGEEVSYDPSLPPPRPMPVSALSPEHGAIGRDQLNHLWDLAGISDLARGHIPSGLSGRTVGMSHEVEATLMGPTVREMESALQDVAQMELDLWRDNVNGSRTLRLIGEDRKVEVIDFHSRDIGETVNVFVQPNSMLPKHRSYRQEQVLMWFQQGLFGNPAEPTTQQTARKMMEFGSVEELFQDSFKERQHAKLENYWAMEGKEPTVEPWEKHDVHIDEHLSFMRSEDFRQASLKSRRLLVIHLARHEFIDGQIQQGVPWWRLLDDVELPPDLMEGEQFQPQPPPPWAGVGAQPTDAYGPDPGVPPPDAMMPQQQGPGGAMQQISPGQMAALQGFMQSANLTPQLPETNAGARGPGVPTFEEGY